MQFLNMSKFSLFSHENEKNFEIRVFEKKNTDDEIEVTKKYSKFFH